MNAELNFSYWEIFKEIIFDVLNKGRVLSEEEKQARIGAWKEKQKAGKGKQSEAKQREKSGKKRQENKAKSDDPHSGNYF